MLLLAVLSAIGARFVIVPLNDFQIGQLGYQRGAIGVSPVLENTYILMVATFALKTGVVPFGSALLVTTGGFAFDERANGWADFPASSLRHYVEFWTFAPAMMLSGAGFFCWFRRQRRPWLGFYTWVVIHSVWNWYWLS